MLNYYNIPGILRWSLFTFIYNRNTNMNYFIDPGIANRTFGNRTQSNSIEPNPSIEFDWVRQSNEIERRNLCQYDFRTNRTQSNKSNLIVLNPLDCVRLSSATEHDRTQSMQNEVDKPTRLLRFVTFVHLPFSFWSLDLFVASLLFMQGTSYCFVRRTKSCPCEGGPLCTRHSPASHRSYVHLQKYTTHW